MTNKYYIERISKVIDYIDENIGNKLRLNELAGIAMFSKYHFHRIFKTITGETLNDYIKRIKMIKAYRLLQIDKSICIKDLSFSLGYNSIANFSRDFKDFYGFSPREIKTSDRIVGESVMQNKIKKQNISYTGIQSIPDKYVIFRKITTGYNPETIPVVFDELYKLALHHHFRIEQFIGIGYDDPDFTPADKCRYDACIVVNNNDIPQEIMCNSKTLKGGKFAVFYFEGHKNDIFPAWDYIFKEWLLNSNYIPADRPHWEMYLYSEHYKKGIYNVNLCLPIKSINKLKS